MYRFLIFATLLTLTFPETTPRCGQFLGMRDGYIEDFQLQSSSEDPEYPARKGRPGNDGWCPTEDHAGDLFFHVGTVKLV